MRENAPEAVTPSESTACAISRLHRRRRVGIAAFLVGGVSLVSAGAFASWTTTSQTTSGAVTAAMAAVDLIDANSSTFTAPMSDVLPGDYWYRYVDLRNAGSSASSYNGLITATGDLTGVLNAMAERCSLAWTSSGQCLGTTTTLLADTVATDTGVTVNYGTIAPGTPGAAHVRFRFKMLDTASQTLMGKTGTLAISVSGVTTGGRDRTGS
jgi:hypothetical protein